MRFLAAAGGFFVGLVFGAPFFGALIIGATAFAVTHFIQKANQLPAEPPRRDVAGRVPNPDEEEYAPDGTNPLSLRAYLRHLNQRIRALEDEVEALRVAAPAVAAAPVQPVDQAPIITTPEASVAPQEPSPIGEPAPVMPAEPASQQAEPAPAIPQVEPVQPAPVAIPQLEPAPAPVAQPEPAASAAPATWTPRPEADLAAAASSYEAAAAEPPSAPPPRIERPLPDEAPRGPSLISRLLSGNLVAKVGAIVLFFGVGFLLKFAYDRGMMPMELRLAGVALSAVVVFVLGWRLREQRRLYGLILQGVAGGMLYLDVYFAIKLPPYLVGTVAGFGLFALLGVATAVLAVRQDAKPLVLLGLAGAFLAPILASSGSGNYVLLFSYYLLVNLFVLAVSWFKAWRALNLMGWFFTFGIAALWGARSYHPGMFATVEPFLLAFFAIYLVIPVLFATRQPPELKGLVDGSLVFGTPAAVAVMQSRLVWDLPYGLAWSAAVGAGLYAVLSVMALRHKNMRLLGETYVALAVGLGTLAIFFAFGAYTTFALWTIEGAAILWVSLRQQQLLGRIFAVLVQVAGAIYFFLDFNDYSRANPYFNDAVLGCAIIAGASFLSASLLRRYRETITEAEQIATRLILVWGALWWTLGGVDLIHHGFASAFKPAALVLFFSASALAVEWSGARAGWPMLRGLSAAHPIALLAGAFLQWTVSGHPLADAGWIAWPAGLGSFFWILHRQRVDGFDAVREARYYLGWLVLGGIATWEASWWLDRHEYLYTMALALGGYLAAGMRHRLSERDTAAVRFSTLPLLWATGFWYVAGLLWIRDLLPEAQQPAAGILFVTACALAVELLGKTLRWTALRASGGVHPPLLFLAAFVQLSLSTHPLADYGWLAWPAGLGVQFWILHRQRLDGFGATRNVRYASAWLVLGGIATWEALWWLDKKEYLYTMVLALAGYVAAGVRFHRRERDANNLPLSLVPLLWAMLFWYVAGLLWLHDLLPEAQEPAAAIFFVTASALIAELAGAALRWGGLRASAGAHVILLVGAAIMQFSLQTHPIAEYGWLAWPAGLAGLFWTLQRQRQDEFGVLRGMRYAGAWLLVALLATWEALWWLGKKEYAYTMAIALGGYLAAGLRYRFSDSASGRTEASSGALLWAMGFWFTAAFLWLHERLPAEQVPAALLVIAGSALVYELVARPMAWPVLRTAARLPWLALPAAVFLEFGFGSAGHPFAGWAGIAWLAAWALALYTLWREEADGVDALNEARHTLAIYLPIVLLTWELGWRFADWDYGGAWRVAGLAVPSILAVGAITAARNSTRWPFREHNALYLGVLGPLVLLLMIWSLILNGRAPGSLVPLTTYLPLLNPIDAALAAAAWAAAAWYRTLEDEDRRGPMRKASAVLGFVWLNALVLRSIHYWDGVPYELAELARSVLVQAALSILWTATALGMMLLARRRMDRQPWIIGAVLLAVVVGKLFLIDLANTGTVARIVSFLGVGVMLLIIGYAAPVPPGTKEADRDA